MKRNSVSQIHDEFEAAIDNQDLERALEAEQALQNLDTSLPELYGELSTVIKNEEYEKAKTVLKTIRERMGEAKETQKISVRKAMLARDKKDLGQQESEVVQNAIDAMGAASLQRFSFFTEIITFLSDPDEVNKNGVLETIDEMQSISGQVQNAVKKSDSTVEGYTLPADVNVLRVEGVDGPYSPNTTIEIEAVITNVGEQPAQNTIVTASAESGLELSPESVDFSQVSGGELLRATFSVTPTGTGTHQIQIRADSDNTDISVHEVSVEVSSSDDETVSIKEAIATDGVIRRQDVIEAINLFYSDEPVPGTGGKQIGRQDVIQIISIHYSGGEI